jgi:hypothetical protein
VLGEEFVDDFAEELVGYEGGVLVVGDDDAADAFGAAVRVKGVVCDDLVLELVGVMQRWRLCEVVPCSSTSCRCPGFVLSATVLAKRVMNSP